MQSIPAIIYKATNVINGNFYIGVTKKRLVHRKREHIRTAESRKDIARPFISAIRKYGEDAFEWKIIEFHSDYEQALRAEIRLIEMLRPKYNVTKGGEGGAIVSIFAHKTAMTPERMEAWFRLRGAANRGRKRTPEQIQRMKAAGRPGVHHKSVVCLETGEVYPSIKAAAAGTGASASMVGCCCRGEWIAANGLHFAFSANPIAAQDRADMIANAEVRRATSSEKVRVGRCRPVICINTGELFESGFAAARKHGLCVMRISQICRGNGITKGGIAFMYADATEPPKSKRKTPGELTEIRARQNAGCRKASETMSKRVVCLDDGREFASISECARSIGRCIESVSASIRRNGRAAGLRFAFVQTDP